MRLDELVGQARAVTVLRNAIRRDRVSHAYLFWGPQGVGKSTAASLFAQALNCESGERSETGDACGVCASCALVARGNHPDVCLLSTKSGDDTSVIPIEEIRRSFVRDVYLRPVRGKFKVYVLDPADRTQALAGETRSIDTGLRALEEPPKHVVTVLVTSKPTLLAPTILSRCQQVGFRLADKAGIIKCLLLRGVAPDVATLLADLSGGRTAWAIRAAQRPQVLATRSALLDLCAEFGRQPLPVTLRMAWKMKQLAIDALLEPSGTSPDGEDAERPEEEAGDDSRGVSDRALRAELPWCLDVMASWYRDCLASAQGAPLINADRGVAIAAAAAAVSCYQAEACLEAVLAAREQIERNANIDLTLQCLALDLSVGCA